jgi:hypothetical protein
LSFLPSALSVLALPPVRLRSSAIRENSTGNSYWYARVPKDIFRGDRDSYPRKSNYMILEIKTKSLLTEYTTEEVGYQDKYTTFLVLDRKFTLGCVGTGVRFHATNVVFFYRKPYIGWSSQCLSQAPALLRTLNIMGIIKLLSVGYSLAIRLRCVY